MKRCSPTPYFKRAGHVRAKAIRRLTGTLDKQVGRGSGSGAKDFLEFAQTHKVIPLYITKRVCDSTNDEDPTVGVLRKLGLPVDGPTDRLFCDDGSNGDKTARRRKCAANFESC
jgi:hypothetical protein